MTFFMELAMVLAMVVMAAGSDSWEK